MTSATAPSSQAPAEPVESAIAPRAGLRERKKAKTRAAIQQHALRLFRSQGYARTSVEQIAEAAEVSPSTFFRYFPAKEDTVLTDFMDAEMVEVLVGAPAELSILDALRYTIVSHFGAMSTERLDLELMRNQLIATVPELQRGAFAEIHRPMELLAHAVARRLRRPLDDPELRAYAGAVVGALLASLPVSIDHPADLDDVFVKRLGGVLEVLRRILVEPAPAP